MNAYGVSMGSTTSQELVIDHPERVRKLVLSSSTNSVRIPERVNSSGMRVKKDIPLQPYNPPSGLGIFGSI